MHLQDIIAALSGQDHHLKAQAAEHAMHQGEAAAAAAVYLALHADDSDIGEPCIAALEKLGPPPIETLGGLIELLDKDEMPSYWAATLIGRLGSSGGPAAEKLAATAMRGAPLAVRERAVWALGKLGPAAAAALPVLSQLSQAPQPRLARLAQQAYDAIAPRN